MVEKLHCINKKTNSMNLFGNKRLAFEMAQGPEKMAPQQAEQPEEKGEKLIGEINVSQAWPTNEYRKGRELETERSKQARLELRKNLPELPEKRIV